MLLCFFTSGVARRKVLISCTKSIVNVVASGFASSTSCSTFVNPLAHLAISRVVACEDNVMEIISVEGDHRTSNIRNTFIGNYHEMTHCGSVEIEMSLIKIKI